MDIGGNESSDNERRKLSEDIMSVEKLEDKMDEYNTNYFNPPLPCREVQSIFKQVEDKKYFYRCELPIFKSVCEKIKCQTRQFGVGNSAEHEITNLKKWVSDNPVYEVTHNGKVIIFVSCFLYFGFGFFFTHRYLIILSHQIIFILFNPFTRLNDNNNLSDSQRATYFLISI